MGPRAALAERVKELTCLYGLSRLMQEADLPLDSVLQGIAELVPPAWQHPGAAGCRITVDGGTAASPGFAQSALRLEAGVRIRGVLRGRIEVCYREGQPGVDGARPFLDEERNLLEAIAREVALVVERRQLETERENLLEQARHLDRLVTIGQFAAGLAHELSEPLCSILGLAQLAAKDRELPPQAAADIRRIIESSLHAREIVKSFLAFARAGSSRAAPTAMNQVVTEALDLFTGRCARARIAVRLDLAPGLPEVQAVPTQMRQVLVNLIRNAIQAMPGGGTLTLSTCAAGDCVRVLVADTGIGMEDGTVRRIFTPFFTTREAGDGTGLGLSIVQGIIAAHGGTLAVDSRPGQGSRFQAELPIAHARPHGEQP
jgi:signal transduction histidine kinase